MLKCGLRRTGGEYNTSRPHLGLVQPFFHLVCAMEAGLSPQAFHPMRQKFLETERVRPLEVLQPGGDTLSVCFLPKTSEM